MLDSRETTFIVVYGAGVAKNAELKDTTAKIAEVFYDEDFDVQLICACHGKIIEYASDYPVDKEYKMRGYLPRGPRRKRQNPQVPEPNAAETKEISRGLCETLLQIDREIFANTCLIFFKPKNLICSIGIVNPLCGYGFLANPDPETIKIIRSFPTQLFIMRFD